MLKKKITLPILALLLSCIFAAAQQEDKKPDPVDMAEQETERLEKDLLLEDWQVFYVDSILVNNYTELFKEMEALSKARVENKDLYISVQDKWLERTENAYRKVFTEEQWALWLKHGGERMIKERAKRQEKANNAMVKKEKKKRN